MNGTRLKKSTIALCLALGSRRLIFGNIQMTHLSQDQLYSSLAYLESVSARLVPKEVVNDSKDNKVFRLEYETFSPTESIKCYVCKIHTSKLK